MNECDEDYNEVWRGFTTMIPRTETSLSVFNATHSNYKKYLAYLRLFFPQLHVVYAKWTSVVIEVLVLLLLTSLAHHAS